MGLMSLQHVNVGEDEVRFSSFSGNFQVVKEDGIKLKAYLVDKFGKPSNDKNIDILSSEDLTKGYHIEWQNKAYYMLYHDEKNDHYHCIIKIFRKKEFAENVQISSENRQKENDFKVFLEAPLDYPMYRLHKMDPKCFSSKEWYTLSKEACEECSCIWGLKVLNYIYIDSNKVSFHSISNDFYKLKNDALKYKEILNERYGDADIECNLSDINSKIIKSNELCLKWTNVCSFCILYREKDERFECSMDLFNPKV